MELYVENGRESNGEFEVAIICCEAEASLINWFPDSGSEQAILLAAALAKGDLVSAPCFGRQIDKPIVITHKDKKWLLIRDLVPSAGLGILIDATSDRWQDQGLLELASDAVFLCDADGYNISMCRESAVGEIGAPETDMRAALRALTSYAWDAGGMVQAGNCIAALARILGCGLELGYEDDVIGGRDIPVGAAAAISAVAMLWCRKISAERSARMTLSRRADGVELFLEFELCEELCLETEDISGAVEAAVCRRLADRYNTIFDLTVEQGGVRARFCPKCREWSYLGLKLPAELEYDEPCGDQSCRAFKKHI